MREELLEFIPEFNLIKDSHSVYKIGCCSLTKYV